MRIIIETFHNLEIDQIIDITGVAGTVLQNHVVVEIADAPTAANVFFNLHLAGFGVEMASPIHPFTLANEWQEDDTGFTGDDESGWHLSERMLTALAELEALPF